MTTKMKHRLRRLALGVIWAMVGAAVGYVVAVLTRSYASVMRSQLDSYASLIFVLPLCTCGLSAWLFYLAKFCDENGDSTSGWVVLIIAIASCAALATFTRDAGDLASRKFMSAFFGSITAIFAGPWFSQHTAKTIRESNLRWEAEQKYRGELDRLNDLIKAEIDNLRWPKA